MRLLELLRLARNLIDLPNFSDKEATRQWLLLLCGTAAMITSRTPTQADDAVLAFLKRAIGDPKLYDPIYDLLTALLAGAGESQKVGLTPALAAEANKAGIDPLTILAIVEAVAALIRLIRERRGAK